MFILSYNIYCVSLLISCPLIGPVFSCVSVLMPVKIKLKKKLNLQMRKVYKFMVK